MPGGPLRGLRALRLLGDLFPLRLHPPRCIHGPIRETAEPTVNLKRGGDRIGLLIVRVVGARQTEHKYA